MKSIDTYRISLDEIRFFDTSPEKYVFYMPEEFKGSIPTIEEIESELRDTKEKHQ